MWELGNQSVVALISVLSGCVFLYNVWGPILVVTVSLVLVIYVCYSLIINDSLLSPHAFTLFEYCKQVAVEISASFQNLACHVRCYARELWESLNYQYRKHFIARMERRRASNYQLSSDSYPATRTTSRFDLSAQLSPIPRNTYSNISNFAGTENKFSHDSDRSSYDHGHFGTVTSTPFRQKTIDSENGELITSDRTSPKNMSPMYVQNHTLTRGENTTYFSPNGSPWGTSISPKMRPKAAGVKTVQTVAGPLLASTRYNIDPKVYNDVTSPGLTTRLTKYATEANSKLTHQSQYCTGQFPKVNLSASPVPLINSKLAKTRTPVTVRVAPPDVMQYSSPSRQKILFQLCKTENKSPPTVAQVLRDISLKRHASREDVTLELAKKQRTDGVACDEFETLDETKQKRSRDDSSKSEEEFSPPNKTGRPAKRTKTPSCYDILHSLSSSVHVASGVKRKAIDFSRSGTPDFEKHFKSLESVQSVSTPTLPHLDNVKSKESTRDVTEKRMKNSSVHNSSIKLKEQLPLKGILKVSKKGSVATTDVIDVQANCTSSPSTTFECVEPTGSAESIKLTDKLFMRAEPKRNEKLKLLVEEEGSIKAEFTTDDIEEIKKEDIVNMRQTSMKARLQSMFDAISGKGASRINPDVVIQAEDVNVVKSTVCPVTCATLNSSTTTTNVNTTPISTSAVAPCLPATETNQKSPKHVVFNLPSKECLPSPKSTSTAETKTPSVSAIQLNPAHSKTEATPSLASGITETPLAPTTSASNVTSNAQSFPALGKQLSNVTNILPTGAFAFGTVPSSTVSVASATTSLTTLAASNLFGNVSSIARTPVPVSANSNTLGKVEANQDNSLKTLQTGTNALVTPNFTFGNSSLTSGQISASPVQNVTTNEITKRQTAEISLPISTVNSTEPTSSFKDITKTSVTTISAVTSANTAPPIFTFGSKSSSFQSPKSEPFAFGSPVTSAQAGNTFGNPTNSLQSSLIGNTAANTTYTPAQASSTLNSTAAVFDSRLKTTVTTCGTTTPTFSFGANSKPGFSFGAVTTAVAAPATATATSAFSTAKNASSPFGAPSTSSTQFAPATTSIFGSTPTTSIFGMATTQAAFSSPSTTATTGFASPKTAAIFNSKVNTPSAVSTSAPSATSASSVFASSTAPPAPVTTGVLVFGPNASVSASGITSTTSSLFSNVNACPTTSTAGFVGNSNIFGQTKPPTVFGTSSGVFGSNATSLFSSQTTATSTFGTTTASSSTVAPSFGATVSSNVTVPAFGTTNTTTPPSFGTRGIATSATQNPAQSPTVQGFGSAPAMFGTDSSASVFGATTSSSFNPPVTFGSAGSTATFGDNKSSPFGAQVTAASTFGGSATSTPAFGTTVANSGNNNTSNIFSFGSSQKPLQQNTTFSFGGNNTANNNSTTSTPAPFQFEGTNLKPATGFNFTAPSTTPSISFGTTGTPTFNASAPGMFSIGSGSTAPRPRNVRTRKPR